MLPLAGRITEAMQLRFLHIKRYDLSYTWSIPDRMLENAVIWLVEDGAMDLEVSGEGRLHSVAGDLLFLTTGTRLTCRAKTSSLRIVSLNYEAASLDGDGR